MYPKANLRRTITCTECGEKLRNWDFLAGRAQFLATGAYCLVCSPLPSRVRQGTAFAPAEPQVLAPQSRQQF